MKKCPYCTEEIQDEAIKCKHCGSSLVRFRRKLKPFIIASVVVVIIGLFLIFVSIFNEVNEAKSIIQRSIGINHGFKR